MLETADRLGVLTLKHLIGDLTEPEQEELDSLVNSSNYYRQMFLSFTESAQLSNELVIYEEHAKEWAKLDHTSILLFARKKYRYAFFAKTAAAILILVIGTCFFWQRGHQLKNTSPVVAENKVIDIPVGSMKATLRLGDNSVIELDEGQENNLITEKNASIKNEDGLLTYEVSNKHNTSGTAIVENVLTTPAGGYYRLRLSDGTLVWLNAMSSLHYPTNFPGKERRVKLDGEAYFEVMKDPAKPFIVEIDSSSVSVLGTKFNIRSYKNETAKRISLLEGSVAVQNASNVHQTIKPNQQAMISQVNNKITVSEKDVQKEISWVKGVFYFDNASIVELMKQLERWYGIIAEYSSGIEERKEITFQGLIERNLPLSDMLEILQRLNPEIKFIQIGKVVKVSLTNQ